MKENKKPAGKKKWLKITLIVFAVLFVIAGIQSCLGIESEPPAPAAQPAATEQPTEDPAKAYDSLVGTDSFDAYHAMTADGYTVTVVQDGTGSDQTSVYVENPEREDFEFVCGPWTVTAIKDVNADAKTATIVAQGNGVLEREAQAKADEEALSAKLDSGHAMIAVENYGKGVYPYGFKLHSIAGVVNQEAVGEEWHIKVTCDVTNALGAKAKDLMCEAVVTGTNEAPSVTYFVVY